MPAPATAAEFIDLVTRSGVADEAKLRAYLDKLSAADAVPPQPASVAGLLVRDALLTHFQAEQLLQGKWKRFTLGKYKVLERLGSGGMGHVFLCEHKLMRRRVAVKVLPAAKSTDQASIARFYREARAVAAVDHPNIVRAFDVDQDDQLHFLVMEFVDGTNLYDLVKRFGPVDITRACHYVAAAAVGLQHAHEIGLIHRDVKPGNILLDRGGAVKVLDLGLARFFHDTDDSITKQYDEAILGTVDYLSPEQADDSHAVDVRTDVYSLGATFYYLLAGHPPFPEGTIPQKLAWVRSREPRPVWEVRPEVPAGVAAVVARMMAKKPADRFQTPAEVVAALAPWTAAPIEPPPEREMPRLSPAAGGGAAARGSSIHSVPAVRLSAPPPAADGPGVWEALGDADAATTVARHTFVAREPAAEPDRPPAPPRPRRRASPAVVAGGVMAAVALAAGGYALFGRGSPAPPPPPAGGAKRLVVSRAHPGGENTFGSLAAAVRAAGPGDTVVLTDDRLAEPPLRVGRVRDLTIESGLAGGRPAVVEFAPGGGAVMFEVTNAEGLRVKGVEFDGKGAAEVGVQVNGLAPGVVFDRVTVRGVKTAGFRLANAAGTAGRPLTLDRVRVLLSPTTEAGVLVEARGALETKRVAVRNGRFEGPGKAGVRFDGPTADAEVSNNRFYRLDAGVAFGPVAAGRPTRVQVTQNTFHEAKVGLLFAGPGSVEVGVSRNYFARAVAVGQADGGAVAGVTGADNGFDPASAAGNLTVPGARLDSPQLPPPNPDDDSTFLRFPPGGVAQVGAR